MQNQPQYRSSYLDHFQTSHQQPEAQSSVSLMAGTMSPRTSYYGQHMQHGQNSSTSTPQRLFDINHGTASTLMSSICFNMNYMSGSDRVNIGSHPSTSTFSQNAFLFDGLEGLADLFEEPLNFDALRGARLRHMSKEEQKYIEQQFHKNLGKMNLHELAEHIKLTLTQLSYNNIHSKLKRMRTKFPDYKINRKLLKKSN